MKTKSHVTEQDVRCNESDEKSLESTVDSGTSDPPPRPPGGTGGPPPAAKSSSGERK
jgi:hypothetical protein